MKKLCVRLAALVCLCALCACGHKKNALADISDKCDLNLTSLEVISSTDTYDALRRDGFTYTVLQGSDEQKKEIEAHRGHWKALPFDGTLGEFVSRHDWFPKPKNGYYWFYDRHERSTDPYDASAFLERSDYRFTLVVLDGDTNEIYVFQIDT